MNTSKRVIQDIPRNQALFKELTDYTKSYRDLEKEKKNIQYEVRRLEYQNQELQKENNRLQKLLQTIVESLKYFFRKILHIGTEKDKDLVVDEIKEYHKQELYDDTDLHYIADDTSKEEEINNYLYEQNYDYNNDDFDI